MLLRRKAPLSIEGLGLESMAIHIYLADSATLAGGVQRCVACHRSPAFGLEVEKVSLSPSFLCV